MNNSININQRLSGLSLCRSPFILLGGNLIQNLPQVLPTKFRFIWLSSYREEDFQKSTNQKQERPVAARFINGSELNEQYLQMTFQGCFLPSFDSFGKLVSEKKIFQKSINEKQELPVVAMFVNASELNYQSL